MNVFIFGPALPSVNNDLSVETEADTGPPLIILFYFISVFEDFKLRIKK